MSTQPQWTCIANLGDADPITYGGYFVERDKTGVYPEEAEYLDVEDDGTDPCKWTVYRFSLDRCTLTDGILSDNTYHPELAAWFAQPQSDDPRAREYSTLGSVASCMGTTVEELQEQLCSEDPLQRAMAYRCIGEYHGWENLDGYPLEFTDRAEVEERYKDTMAQLKALKA